MGLQDCGAPVRDTVLLVAVVLAGCVTSCGGSEFQATGSGGVAGTGGSATGGGGAAGSGGTAAGGAAGSGGTAASGGGSGGSAGSGSTGGAPPTDGGSCPSLDPNATQVYVNKAFKGSQQTGDEACPFLTIQAGMDAAAKLTGNRVVRVAGASGGLTYDETGAITVPNQVTLKGEGPATTKIVAAGSCGAASCAVKVEGGGALQGFTVTSTGDGVVTGTAMPAPVVKDVVAKGNGGNGILALGAAELGPNLIASNNGAAGVQSPATASGSLHVIGTTNAFDSNAANGLNLDGAATLTFEGGTANGNFQGIRFFGPAAGQHSVSSLTAKSNKGPGGLVAYNGPKLKVRNSTFLQNSGVGLLYTYAAGSTLDLGPSTALPGNNTFGSGNSALNNAKAGLRLCAATGVTKQPALGNAWAQCSPTQAMLACDTTITSYMDVYYAPAGSGDLVDASVCTVGP